MKAPARCWVKLVRWSWDAGRHGMHRHVRIADDAASIHPPSAQRRHMTSVGLATTSLPLSRDRGPPRIMMTKNVGERCVDDFLSSTMYCRGFGKFRFCCGWRAIGRVLDTSSRTEPYSFSQSSRRSHCGHQEEALGLPRVDNRRLAIRVGAGCGFSGSGVGVNGGARPGASSPAEAAARQQKRW